LENGGLYKRQKREFIGGERNEEEEKRGALWGEEERAFLEDVTLNLIPDDDISMMTKGKTAMKWDSKKKRYMLKKVDRDGKIIQEKRNESGAKITKAQLAKGKESIYKKWMKKTHMKL
jgi:DBP10CT (NUC160) domain